MLTYSVKRYEPKNKSALWKTKATAFFKKRYNSSKFNKKSKRLSIEARDYCCSSIVKRHSAQVLCSKASERSTVTKYLCFQLNKAIKNKNMYIKIRTNSFIERVLAVLFRAGYISWYRRISGDFQFAGYCMIRLTKKVNNKFFCYMDGESEFGSNIKCSSLISYVQLKKFWGVISTHRGVMSFTDACNNRIGGFILFTVR